MDNPQIANLQEGYRRMRANPGWEVLEQDGLLALKAPVPQPFANYVWAGAEPGALEVVQGFFGDSPYTWVLQEGQNDRLLRQAGFLAPEAAPDMSMGLDTYAFPGFAPEIQVLRAYSTQDLFFWAATAGQAFGVDGEVMRAFFQPLVREAGWVPFLALHQGRPAATAMAFGFGGTLGIYGVGTRDGFRRLGLGAAVVNACLRHGKEQGLRRAVLSSSAAGVPLYRKLGFQLERTAREYRSGPAA
jgi:ribosomal protein S18 acetylase RimI-like enzyme